MANRVRHARTSLSWVFARMRNGLDALLTSVEKKRVISLARIKFCFSVAVLLPRLDIEPQQNDCVKIALQTSS